jgi:hypothetical protein
MVALCVIAFSPSRMTKQAAVVVDGHFTVTWFVQQNY